jgi:hypothetical protein
MTIDERIEETKRFLEVLEGYKAGKKVQYLAHTGVWLDGSKCSPGGVLGFSELPTRYRLKPEPKEIFVNEYHDFSCSRPQGVAFLSQDTALDDRTTLCGMEPILRAVRYREVVDE